MRYGILSLSALLSSILNTLEIVESERVAAMGQALAGVAHGVKNILHRMKLGAFMVDEGLDHGRRC